MIKDWVFETFQKRFNDLTDDDLRNIVDQETHHEGQNLDFKTLINPMNNSFERSSIDQVSKCVSALSNSDGGLIIVGLAEATKIVDGRQVKYASAIKPIPLTNITKEQLRDSIKSQISPTPLFEVSQRKYPLAGLSNDYVYLINVPKSEIRPHQSITDRKYYARRVDTNEPLLHWEIENIRDKEKTFFTAKLRINQYNRPFLYCWLNIKNEGIWYSQNIGLLIERIDPGRVGRNSILESHTLPQSGNIFYNNKELRLMAGEMATFSLTINFTDAANFTNEFIVHIQSPNSNLIKYRFLVTQNNNQGDELEGERVY